MIIVQQQWSQVLDEPVVAAVETTFEFGRSQAEQVGDGNAFLPAQENGVFHNLKDTTYYL